LPRRLRQLLPRPERSKRFMTKRRRTVLFGLSLAILSTASAQDYRAVKDKVTIRADSTVTSASLGCLKKGHTVKVIGERYDWYKIILPKDFLCYAATQFLTKQKPDNNRLTVSANRLNLRDKPSLDSDIIGSVKQGDMLTAAGEKDGWFKIKGYPHAHGWIHKSFLQKTEPPPEDSALLAQKQNFTTQMRGLREAAGEKKKEIRGRLIEKGDAIIPQLESYLDDAAAAKDSIAYDIIYILGEIGKKNLKAADDFLDKTGNGSPSISAAYLDIAQDILEPRQNRKPYFYLAQNNKLTIKDIEIAKKNLQKLYGRRFNANIPK